MIDDHMKAISIALDDLIYLCNYDKDILNELFYNRDKELSKFKSHLENICVSSDNILIVGEAGIGKTCFVYKLVNDTNMINENNLYPIVIDYSKIAPRSVGSSLLYFLKDIKKYFEDMKIDCNEFMEMNEENITNNFHILTNHLRLYQNNKPDKHCIIFIDDIDYAEDDWCDLLKYFMPLSISPMISIVLTVRPYLYSAIENYDDRISYFFTRNVKDIELEPLSVENLLSSRLAPFLVENAGRPFHRFITNLFSRQGRLSKIIKKYGINDYDDLNRIEYPFTEKHNNFMNRISNGNIREIFDIAYESFLYILKNENLAEREENGIHRKIIGREGVLQLFYDNDKSKYKIININLYKNKKGNSRYYNVLEAIKLFRNINEDFYDKLHNLGHKKKEIDETIEQLASKNFRLIRQKNFIRNKVNGTICCEYLLTEKGNYYLEMAEWEEYKKRCENYGKSLSLIYREIKLK